MSEELLKLTDEELDAYLDEKGLLEPLKRGELAAIEQYFQLFGAKLTILDDMQPTNS